MRSAFSTLIAILVCQALFAQGDHPIDFRSPIELPFTGDGLESRFGDIDGDGDNDVVVATTRKPVLFVVYNDEGAFTRSERLIESPPGQYSDGAKVNGGVPFTLYDYDGDGVSDIVTAPYHDDYQTSEVLVFRTHHGQLEKFTTIELATTDFFAINIFCTDLKNDALPDIILKGNRTVTLEMTEPGVFTENASFVNEAYVRTRSAELNNDGHIDLTFKVDNKVIIIESDDDGYFTSSRTVTASKEISSYTVADFNHDEINDMIVAGDGFVNLLIQDENGAFTSQKIYTPAETPYVAKAVDVDNDGDMDVAIDRRSFTDFIILTNNGDNTFEPVALDLGNISVLDVDFADVDGDDIPEMMPSGFAGHIEIFKRNGDDYQSYANFIFSANPSGYGTLSDVNNDGILDLALVHNEARAVSIAYGTRNKKMFGKPVYFRTDLRPFRLTSGDYNNDSYADIVYTTARETETHLNIIWGGPGGELVQEVLEFSGIYPDPSMLETGDFNNDGIDDFVSQVNLFYGSANGTFTVGSMEVNPSITYQTAGDFNADGFSDVIMGNYSGSIRIKWGKEAGGGMLVSGLSLPASSVETLSVGKLNDDDFDDIVYYDFPSRLLNVLINNGDSTFVIHTMHYATGLAIYDIADFDLDGIGEIVLFENDDGVILSFYKYNGSGLEKIGAEKLPKFLPIRNAITGIINDDEIPDIVFIDYNLPVSVMLSDVVVEPTVAPKNVSVTERTLTSAKITFEPGNGNGRLLSLREATAEFAEPVDNKFYLGSPIMDHGFDIGSENYVVLAGEDTSIVVTGLKTGVMYHYLLFESDENQKKTKIDYLTSSYASGSFTTKLEQLVTFHVDDKTFGDGDFTLEATSNMELPITYEVISGNVTITGNTVTMNGPGPVTIKAIQEGNDDYYEASAEATFCINPAKPVITVSELTLTSSSIENNTWYLNNILIEGATEQAYTPEADGIYMVVVTYENCSAVSDPATFTIAGIGEVYSRVEISPNPTTKKLFIKVDASEMHTVQPVVIDMTGRSQHFEAVAQPGGIELNVANLTPGLYFLKVRPGLTFKFLKE